MTNPSSEKTRFYSPFASQINLLVRATDAGRLAAQVYLDNVRYKACDSPLCQPCPVRIKLHNECQSIFAVHVSPLLKDASGPLVRELTVFWQWYLNELDAHYKSFLSTRNFDENDGSRLECLQFEFHISSRIRASFEQWLSELMKSLDLDLARAIRPPQYGSGPDY